MGILDDFKQRESHRINTFFDKVDRLEEAQIDDLVKYIFSIFYGQGFIGTAAAKALIVKVNKLLGISYVPQKGEFDRWHDKFKEIEPKAKRALVVTVSNDLCNLNVVTEAQIYTKFDDLLSQIPGVKNN